MNTGCKFAKFAGITILCLFLLNFAFAATAHSQRKAKKAPQLPPLPSGPTGPVPQIPLESMAPVPPQVTYQNGLLTIVANNSTLGDILRAVHKETGAEIEVPAASDRVVTRLGPASPQEVISDLLNGSRFNYILLGSPEHSGELTRIVLVPKSAAASDSVMANNQQAAPERPMANQAGNADVPQPAPDSADADSAQENADETAEQASEADQQPNPPDQPADQPEVKTPQQMLQEMQQRQLQLQQQQQQGQPPVPGPGVPQRPQPDQQ